MRDIVSRFAAFAVFSFVALQAQPSTVSFRVFTSLPGARFAVDGTIYTSAASFQWPAGSKHTVQFVQDALPSASAFVFTTGSVPTLSPVQITPDGASVFTFTGFSDANGLLVPGTDPNQVVTADPAVPSLMLSVSLTYRVLLNFFDNPADNTSPTCGAPGNIPSGEFRAGLVYIGSQCYWNNAILYFPANSTLQLNAFPFPGFVFTGWSSNVTNSNAYLQNYVLTGPITIAPIFQPAKRVRFETSPLGLQALVDRTPTPTLSSLDPNAPCPHNEGLPVTVPSTVSALCRGDFDFAAGSAHLVGAPTPQYDLNGNIWVFDSWGNGQGENAVYTTDANTATPDTVLIRFVSGVQASFVTAPSGLKLSVDGRTNWPAYNFVWGSGTTHQVSAPTDQLDSQGRKFTFRSWSNGGSVSQSLTVDASSAVNVRMIANYDGLGRVVVQTSPPGQKVQVDGADCPTPCTIDRANGSSVHVTAPASIPAAGDTRLDFSTWSDGGAADHVYTMGSDSQVLTAAYTTSYLLTVGSDPANSVTYTFDPASPDFFFPAASQINVSAGAKPGFKFRRWAGDLGGTFPSGTLTMSAPRSVQALMDRVPYIAPAGVHNVAGVTPDGTVAPGSIIAITGESLTTDQETGRVNPLAQTIGGVTVTLGDRLLPLLWVAPQQITAQLPSDLSDGDYTLQVHSTGQPDVSGDFTVARNAPGLLSTISGDTAYCMCSHADGTPVTNDSPAKHGETVTLLGTGFGGYAAPMIDGFFPFDPAPTLTDPVQLSIGAASGIAPVWAGAASGYTGLTATQFKITDDMPGGSPQPIMVTVNGKNSNTVMLPMQ